MMNGMDARREEIIAWLNGIPAFTGGTLTTASADASFRRYFRLTKGGDTFVVMDAPPEKEPCEPFVRIALRLREADVHVPEIYAQDLKRGYLVLSDFGDLHYQEALEGDNREGLYDQALAEILKFQTGLRSQTEDLPVYDEDWIRMELEIFREWCLPDFPKDEYGALVSPLVEAFGEQPQTFVHRDFHCRNLLLPADGCIGVIDFQGAMRGPVTYDPVSLLRDCYVDNDENWIRRKALAHKQALEAAEFLPADLPDETFLRWLDLTGLQRHLKCVGIFHRLSQRDGKHGYLGDVPRVLRYAKQVLNHRPELVDLAAAVKQAKLAV